MDVKNGMLLLLVGPTASGKTTLLKELLKRRSEAARLVTATTRAPRPGEIDGKDYRFFSREEFEQKIRDGFFLEYARVHGQFYGTPKEEIERALASSELVVIGVDVRGSINIKKSFPERTVTAFILPPSSEEMLSRLKARGSESEASIRRRLKTCVNELKKMPKFDYWVTNGVIEEAVKVLDAIIIAEQNRMQRRLKTETWTIENLNV